MRLQRRGPQRPPPIYNTRRRCHTLTGVQLNTGRAEDCDTSLGCLLVGNSTVQRRVNEKAVLTYPLV